MSLSLLKSLSYAQVLHILLSISCFLDDEKSSLHEGYVVVVVVVVAAISTFFSFSEIFWNVSVQIGSNLSKLDQTCPNSIKHVQIGSNLSKLDQTCPNWIKPVQIG